jgi:Cu(I)/Ag(I) efflux system membrane protein CusA/SilA
MTATAIIAGLIPIMWSSGTGSEVMKRIAAPMVGGMVTVTVLCLLVLPAIYGLALQGIAWMQRRGTDTERGPAGSL